MEKEDYLAARSIVLSGESAEEWNALRLTKGDWPVGKQHWKSYRHFSIHELKEIMLEYSKRKLIFDQPILFATMKLLNSIESKVSAMSYDLTPSNCCEPEHYSKFTHLNESLKLEIPPNIAHLAESDKFGEVNDSCTDNFKFNWELPQEKHKLLPEESSYLPFADFLTSLGEKAVVVASGQGLPFGLLFNVAVHSMKSDLSIRSGELRKTFSEPKHIFNISGRSDLVVLRPGRKFVSRMSIRFAVEVKVKGFSVKEGLREAYLQLVGLNVCNINTSPPMLLTDLNSTHYLLWFEKVSDQDTVSPGPFKLLVRKYSNILTCIVKARELGDRDCITHCFGSPPSLQSSLSYHKIDRDEDACEGVLVE